MTSASEWPSQPELPEPAQDGTREVPGALWGNPVGPLSSARCMSDGATSWFSRRSPLAVFFCFLGQRPSPKLLIVFFRN